MYKKLSTHFCNYHCFTELRLSTVITQCHFDTCARSLSGHRVIMLLEPFADDSYHRRCGVDTDNSDPYYQLPPLLPRPRPGHGITRCADNCLGSDSGLWPGPVRDGAEEGWPGSISWTTRVHNLPNLPFRHFFANFKQRDGIRRSIYGLQLYDFALIAL